MQKLKEPLVTPTTKDDVHDELISAEDLIEAKMISSDQWAYCESKALQLFAYGQKVAQEHGLILADTKYEFGVDSKGQITLIDEIHSPDSSRYWTIESYENNVSQIPSLKSNSSDPPSLDKDLVRRWYKQQCDPYAADLKVLPPMPQELRMKTRRIYFGLYELLTDQTFVACRYSCADFLRDTGMFCSSEPVRLALLMMGSLTDRRWCRQIAR